MRLGSFMTPVVASTTPERDIDLFLDVLDIHLAMQDITPAKQVVPLRAVEPVPKNLASPHVGHLKTLT